jgi:hypothetical protein
MVSNHIFSNRDFRKRSSDDRQKKGGKVYKFIQERNATLEQLGTPRPQPSMHSTMRKKGTHGPALKTKARAKWEQDKAKEYANK